MLLNVGNLTCCDICNCYHWQASGNHVNITGLFRWQREAGDKFWPNNRKCSFHGSREEHLCLYRSQIFLVVIKSWSFYRDNMHSWPKRQKKMTYNTDCSLFSVLGSWIWYSVVYPYWTVEVVPYRIILSIVTSLLHIQVKSKLFVLLWITLISLFFFYNNNFQMMISRAEKLSQYFL